MFFRVKGFHPATVHFATRATGGICGTRAQPSWGEPYTEIATRMTAALHRARIKAAGHEAVCVSHQLPVETLRRSMTNKPLHHFPTHRLCNLASLTSFYFHGDTYVGWGYAELAGQ